MEAVIDPLEHFLQWWMSKVPVMGWVPSKDCIGSCGDVTSVVLYRKAPFQVQMFIAPPGCVIPEHQHPNVDSFEIYIGGQILFTHNGQPVLTPDEANGENPETGMSAAFGKVIRVKPNDPHGGVFGESGGVFHSVQMWLNGIEPRCVGSDYIGVTMGPKHNSQVVSGNPLLPPKVLTPVMAGAQ